MAIPTKSQADQLRGIEERLEALERKRPLIPPGELRDFDEFVADLRDTIEILRRDVENRQQAEASA
jgi:hypothetical protein